MDLTVSELIKRAGGADEISAVSAGSSAPVTPSAVHKWRVNGIPETHWAIFMDRAGASVEMIYRANESLRKSKPGRTPNECAA